MSGVFGVYSIDEASVVDPLFKGLAALQSRGEAGAGISTAKNKIIIHKGSGFVHQVLKDELKYLHEISPFAGIGHTLYEKTGDLQPIEFKTDNYKISLAMDGTILGDDREKSSTVVGNLFSRYLEETKDIYKASERLMEELNGKGSYCITMLIADKKDIKLVSFRDPKGINPLCLGKRDNTYIISSETAGLNGSEAVLLRYVEPGEIIIISKEGLDSKLLKKDMHAHCVFGWIYFFNPISKAEGVHVYSFRKRLGEKLAQKYPLDVDFIMASPDSGRGVALGYSHASGIPFEEAAVKNPGALRTFMVEDEVERKIAAEIKFNIDEDITRGKKIALGDDSIVRGTVIRDGMIHKLKKVCKAKEVHLLISCPPLVSPCFKNFGDRRKLAAQDLCGRPIEEINKIVAKKLGADSVCYPTIEMMKEALGIDDLCMACLDAKYPIKKEHLPPGYISMDEI